jgi:hypothetical protein
MTGNSSHIRQPSERPGNTAPYATLRGADGSTAQSAASQEPIARSQPAKDFAAEADKLEALRGALWDAFEAGPAAGLPNTLIDLTMAYTGALRLQLNLRAVAARELAPHTKAALKPRLDPRTRERL